MNWYKTAQEQLELGIEDSKPVQKRLKTDPYSIDMTLNSITGMLFQNQVPDENIKTVLKDLKDLKDRGVINIHIGNSVYKKFDKVCNYLHIPQKEQFVRRKEAYDRLHRLMEELI
jgi:hypothetical protein